MGGKREKNKRPVSRKISIVKGFWGIREDFPRSPTLTYVLGGGFQRRVLLSYSMCGEVFWIFQKRKEAEEEGGGRYMS